MTKLIKLLVSGARLAGLLSALVMLALTRRAEAHEIGLSRGEYALVGAVVTLDFVLSRSEAAAAVPELDADHNGAISAEELERARGPVRRAIVDRMEVKGNGATCAGSLTAARLVEEDGLELRARYQCPAPPSEVHVELWMLTDLAPGHRHIVRFPGGELVLSKSRRSFQLGPSTASEAASPGLAELGLAELFPMGIEHILTGYDHLVFLLGLVLVGGKFRSILLAITAFTVAHSISLALLVLGVWVPSPRLIEPLIGVSIAYVGVENFFVKDAEKRWRMTLPFGFVHGFGFASALGQIKLPPSEAPGALLVFNLGVEVGQAAVLALALPAVLAARKRAWFRDKGAAIVSGAIAALGLFWSVTRALELL